MKGFSKKSIDRIETLVGVGSTINGAIVANNSLLINGVVTGSVTTESTIRVGTTGVIKGDVRARSAIIGGVIEGNLDTKENTILGAQSKLMGDLRTTKLKIEEGATFEGRCVMLKDPWFSPISPHRPSRDWTPALA